MCVNQSRQLEERLKNVHERVHELQPPGTDSNARFSHSLLWGPDSTLLGPLVSIFLNNSYFFRFLWEQINEITQGSVNQMLPWGFLESPTIISSLSPCFGPLFFPDTYLFSSLQPRSSQRTHHPFSTKGWNVRSKASPHLLRSLPKTSPKDHTARSTPVLTLLIVPKSGCFSVCPLPQRRPWRFEPQ